ncbi:MAG: DUF58 domain-containing protein [Armatimonadota bacterium]
MIPGEIIRKIRRIEIRTNRLVNEVLAGEYQSVFRGQGVEFAEVREYQPGDDVRTIDWNVTARMRRPYVKRYVEERELTVMLLVDASGSLDFGTATQMKGEVVAEIAALIVFTDRVEEYIPPQKGRKHVLRLVRDLLYFRPEGRGTNLAEPLDLLMRVTRRRAVAFVLSDFRATGYERALRLANQRHDVIAITVTDPREEEVPRIGLVELRDAETGQHRLVDTSQRAVREAFGVAASAARQGRQRTFSQARVDHIDVHCDRPYIEPLIAFFAERAKRFR